MADQDMELIDANNHPSGIVPMIQNIVSTVNLDCKLNLKEIAMKARNAEYNPKRFSAVTIRLKYPKTTGLIFESGKIVCTGAKTEAESKLAARKYARMVQKLGFPAKFKNFKIQNIVTSCDVNFLVKLDAFQFSNGGRFSNDPQVFPNRMVFKMKQPEITILIFVSGKIVITGAKERGDAYNAFEHIYPLLTQCKKVVHKM